MAAIKWTNGDIITAEKFNSLGVQSLSDSEITNSDISAGQIIHKESDDSFFIKVTNSNKKLRDEIPIGSIRMFISRDFHSDFINTEFSDIWRLCDGSELPQTDYPELFAILNVSGITLEIPDDSANFKLPNLQDRYIRGESTSSDIGSTGGENSHQLTIDELPSHTHTWNLELTNKEAESGTLSYYSWYLSGTSSFRFTGQDQPHENRPSSLCVRFYIKVKQ